MRKKDKKEERSKKSSSNASSKRAAMSGFAVPKTVVLRVDKSLSPASALTNCVYVHKDDAAALTPDGEVATPVSNYVLVKGFVFNFLPAKEIERGKIALSSIQRRTVDACLNEELNVTTFIPTTPNIYLASLTLEVDTLQKSTRSVTLDAEKIQEVILREFVHQFLSMNQLFVADVSGCTLKFQVIDLEVANLQDLGRSGGSNDLSADLEYRGILMKKTTVVLKKAKDASINITGAASGRGGTGLIRHGWNFEQMGIGGLDAEFNDIFRRAFASRIFPASFINKMGIKHVKGILLYGPPGTGKTLMARQIGKMLNGKEPKIVNGPEILNKYVGQSEENIRILFAEAEADYKNQGDDSELHILIFDEIDAICSQRGTRSGSTGVADTVVNQLLSKIDGVEALNNILVIGMTNRKDLIDEALLRPGRLEVHMEIGLPDSNGRLQILRIHTAKMRENGYLDGDVRLEELAEQRTKNFSGAEIEGLVKSAASFAFDRQIDVSNPTKPIDPATVKVCMTDFEHALDEVKPAFGVSSDQFENAAPNGLVPYGPDFERIMHTGRLFIQQVRNSNRTPLVSVLLEGHVGSGKTALACSLAMESDFPYVKLVSPETLVGYNEVGKCNKITKCFEDAYKSPLSVIVVDDIERILDYVPIGPRFSNAILQTLLVLLKRPPPKGRKLLILATSSNRSVLEAMEFMDIFNQVLHVPDVNSGREVATVLESLGIFDQSDLNAIAKQFHGSIPVKKLMMIAEMANQSTEGSMSERFFQCLMDTHSGSFSSDASSSSLGGPAITL